MPYLTLKLPCSMLTDRAGLAYFGMVVEEPAVETYLAALGVHVGEPTLTRLMEAKARRDGPGSYHITTVSPPEMDGPITDWERLVDSPQTLRIDLHGVGSVRDEYNVAFYIIAESSEIDTLRVGAGLPPRTLHVTLGFFPEDIYDQQKGRSTEILQVGR